MVFPEWEENVISVWRLEFDMVMIYCLLLSFSLCFEGRGV